MEGFGRKGLITRGMKNATLYRPLHFFFFSLLRVEEVKEEGKEERDRQRGLSSRETLSLAFSAFILHMYILLCQRQFKDTPCPAVRRWGTSILNHTRGLGF